MYIIKMCNDKSLLTVSSIPLYQGENNIDTINFFIPTQYNNIDITSYTVTLEYILPNGIYAKSILEKSESEYTNYTLYNFTITSNFTQLSGNILYWINITDQENNTILKTSQSNFVITSSIIVN